MSAIRIQGFGGMIPALDNHLLADNAASRAVNTWLYSGALIGIPEEKSLHVNATPGTSKVYRLPASYTSAGKLDDSTWLEFTNRDTDVFRAPVVDDTFDRYYWASTSHQPKYNTRARIDNGDDPWLLGIPAPGTAPSIIVTGGTAPTATRSYVYTWVSTYGEEGPPSPPVTVTGNQNGSWDVTMTAADAGDLGVNRTLATVRIYRTITSASGVATYFFVAEQAITDTTYSDTRSDSAVSSESQLESTNWSAPPTDLEGWIQMPNGMVAAWRSNEIWFSEPYRPHAWPASYTLAVEYPIVGLGVINQTLVVCTTGFPMTAVGVHPSVISTSKLSTFEPCTSRGSIISAPEGVYYSSFNGLVKVIPGRAENITKNLITKDEWQDIFSVDTIVGARLGTALYFFGTASTGVFFDGGFETTAFVQEDLTSALIGCLIDPTNERVAFSLLDADDTTTNVFNDQWTGDVFVIRNNTVYWIDNADPTPTITPYLWRSKNFQLPKKANLGAMKVYFEVPTDTPALNPTPNYELVQDLAADQYGLVRIYADGELRYTRELRTSGELWRLPTGFKADYYQFEVEGRVRVLNMQIASTPKELMRV